MPNMVPTSHPAHAPNQQNTILNTNNKLFFAEQLYLFPAFNSI